MMPPASAPGTEPNPPSTTITYDRPTISAPTQGTQLNIGISAAPDIAASIEPIAKDSVFILVGLMPVTAAACRSWLVARKARPVQERCKK